MKTALLGKDSLSKIIRKLRKSRHGFIIADGTEFRKGRCDECKAVLDIDEFEWIVYADKIEKAVLMISPICPICSRKERESENLMGTEEKP